MIKYLFIIFCVWAYIIWCGVMWCNEMQTDKEHNNTATSMCLPYQLKHWYIEGKTVRAVCLSRDGSEVLK